MTREPQKVEESPQAIGNLQRWEILSEEEDLCNGSIIRIRKDQTVKTAVLGSNEMLLAISLRTL